MSNKQYAPCSIWVVDDDPICRFIAEKMMDMALSIDYELAFFENGQFAIEALMDPAINTPDLILLDINMPIMDGFEFLESLQTMDKNFDLQIAIISSSSHNDDKRRAEAYPEVIGFLSKPLSPESMQFLIDRIQKH